MPEENTRRLESEKAIVERQCMEKTDQLEDEIDDSISLLVNKFEKKIRDENEHSERQALESGIFGEG